MYKLFKSTWLATAAVVACCLAGHTARAGLITFESGFSEGDVVTAVNTLDNVVTFSVPGSSNAWIHAVGGPTTAFVPNDTPSGGNPGEFFLSDEPTVNTTDAMLTNVGDYFMDFANPISSLSVDTYDYRADGGSQPQDTVMLELASDSAFLSIVGSDMFTITGGEADGITRTLSVNLLDGTRALFARIRHSGSDIGTGIDNLRFGTVPEPSSAVVWSLLGVALFCARRRRRAGR